jgi:hypothetical protein
MDDIIEKGACQGQWHGNNTGHKPERLTIKAVLRNGFSNTAF